MTGRAALVAAALAGALVAAPATLEARREPTGRVVFARGDALWLTDGMGKAKPVAIATLPAPASEVRAIRTDAAGSVLLVEVGDRWYWTPMPAAGATATLAPLPCAPGPARLTRDGRCVLCADDRGRAWFFRLVDGLGRPRDVPAAGASFVEKGGVRALVWPDPQADAVVWSPLAAKEPKTAAAGLPLRGLLAAPDGSRAVGVVRAPAVGQPRVSGERDQLVSFALDGIGARRRLIRDGVALDWSWDSQWLLVQDGGSACIVRPVGGEYKCWKGYTAVSLAADGAFALVLGARKDADGSEPAAAEAGGDDEGEGEGNEEGDDDGELDDGVVALPKGKLSLYRASLAGPYSTPPAVIVSDVDGAAAWLPPAP